MPINRSMPIQPTGQQGPKDKGVERGGKESEEKEKGQLSEPPL